MAAIIVFRMCGFCVDDQMVIVSLRFPMRQHAARLHRVRHEAMVHHALADLYFGVGKRLVDRGVVDLKVGRRPCRSAPGQPRGCWKVRVARLAFHGGFGIDDDRERIVLDDDRVRGIAREIAIGCDDDGNGLAGVTHDVDGRHGGRRRTACRSASARGPWRCRRRYRPLRRRPSSRRRWCRCS